MTGEWLGAIGAVTVGLTTLAGVVYAAREKRARENSADLTTHAEKVLREAMVWQAATIEELRQRVVALEAEVIACELGRTADRLDFDAKLIALEARLTGP